MAGALTGGQPATVYFTTSIPHLKAEPEFSGILIGGAAVSPAAERPIAITPVGRCLAFLSRRRATASRFQRSNCRRLIVKTTAANLRANLRVSSLVPQF
jgi:hypothetical protein